MDRVTSTAIDIVEAAYDLHLEDGAWFTRLLEVGEPLFEKGFGTAIRVIERPADGGPVQNRELPIREGFMTRVHVSSEAPQPL